MISLQNVSKIYKQGGEEIFALNEVNLGVGRGEFVAVVGPSGSGKSTLLNMVGGLDRPTSGSVFVDGEDLNRLSDIKLSLYRNQRVGFIFQTASLEPSLSALDNVALPLLFSGVARGERRKVASELLTWLGLGERVNYKPTKLSGGQRQRVAIARALISRPQIILADEPTGNLDSAAGCEVLDILDYINKKLGVTLVLVTHNAEAARRAMRIFKMRDGRIME